MIRIGRREFNNCLCPQGEFSFSAHNGGFPSVRQYYEISKAQYYKNSDMVVRMMNVKDESGLMSMAERIEGFDERIWNGMAGAVLYRGLVAFFESSPYLVPELMKTDDEVIVYCDPLDPILGNGLEVDDDANEKMENWKGQNLYGFTLMAVREYFRKKMPEAGLFTWNEIDLGYIEDSEFYYDPCEPKGPYVYLHYSPLASDEAMRKGAELRKKGYRVYYDQKLLLGRIWTGERADAIANARAFEWVTSGKKTSPLESLGLEYAELLKITFLVTEEAQKYGKKKDQEPMDLFITYTSKGKTYKANVRTGEQFDEKGEPVIAEYEQYVGTAYEHRTVFYRCPDLLTQEKLYRIVSFGNYEASIGPKSPERDYIGTPEDWEFCLRIREEKTGMIQSIEDEISEIKNG